MGCIPNEFSNPLKKEKENGDHDNSLIGKKIRPPGAESGLFIHLKGLEGEFGACINQEKEDGKKENQIADRIDDSPSSGGNRLVEDVDSNVGFETEGVGRARARNGSRKESR